MMKLDRNSVLDVPKDGSELVGDEEEDPLSCTVCQSGDASAENPIVKCDGAHETEVGVHLNCMDPMLDGGVPKGEWFCPGQDCGG